MTRPMCWLLGHKWLMRDYVGSREYVCQPDSCMRVCCRLKRTIHATVTDDLTGKGGGGCVHGHAGEVTIP